MNATNLFVTRLAIGAAAVGCTTGTTLAQGYPAGPVRMIVPFPAGGGATSSSPLTSSPNS